MRKHRLKFTARRQNRREQLARKLQIEPLENRWLLNADGRRPRPEAAATPLLQLQESLHDSSNMSSIALSLVEHPRLAMEAGLGGLSSVLRQNAGYAAQHGWAATLSRVLDAHPRYTAAHHLTAFLATQTTAPGTTAPVSSTPASPTPARPRPRRARRRLAKHLSRHNPSPRPPRPRRALARPRNPSSFRIPFPSPSAAISTSPCRISAWGAPG